MPRPPKEVSLTVLSQSALDRAKLGEVTHLNVWTERIHDLSRLRRATRLRKVVLDETSVRDLGPLVGATALEAVHLFDNLGVRDLTPLSQLSRLKTLEVGAPKSGPWSSHGLRSIAALPALTSLMIWSAERARLEWVGSLHRLEKLLIYGGRVDARWLSGLVRLRELNLTRTHTTDLGPLAGLVRLEDLWLPENKLTDLRPLRHLRRLTRLLLGHNAIEDIKPLTHLDRLVRLDLDYNRISRLPPLDGLTHLESLDLSHNRLVAPRVEGLKRLEDLRLNHNQLGRVSGIRDLPRLKYLWLANNRLRDVRPVEKLRSLVVVELGGNRVDGSFLMALPKMHRIDSVFKPTPAR